jgi:excisionase family DNA binding protein
MSAPDTPAAEPEVRIDRGSLTPTLGVVEAAALLRCHPDTVCKMAAQGEIPAAKVGRSWVFCTELLLAWLAKRCEQPKPSSVSTWNPKNSLAARLQRRREERQRERELRERGVRP